MNPNNTSWIQKKRETKKMLFSIHFFFIKIFLLNIFFLNLNKNMTKEFINKRVFWKK